MRGRGQEGVRKRMNGLDHSIDTCLRNLVSHCILRGQWLKEAERWKAQWTVRQQVTSLHSTLLLFVGLDKYFKSPTYHVLFCNTK